MKSIKQKTFYVLIAVLLLSSCASLKKIFQESPEAKAERLRLEAAAKNISVVESDAFRIKDLALYVEAGAVGCLKDGKYDYDSETTNLYEECRKDLKWDAAKLGAEFVLIEKKKEIPCAEKKKLRKGCWEISGRAYKNRPQATPAAPAAKKAS